MTDGEKFEGFTKPDSHYFRIPNDFVDAMAIIDNMSELKVVLYIMRHTWGFEEYDDHKKITTDEFMYGRKLRNRERMDKGTGLSDNSIKHAIAKAVEHGFIECEVDDYDRARIKKSYRLRLKPSAEKVEEKPENKQKKPISANSTRITELQSMPYSEYLKTPEWQKKRAKALKFAQYRCQLCNDTGSLNVHHRTYERLGHEQMGDLITLCNDCHSIFHQNKELVE